MSVPYLAGLRLHGRRVLVVGAGGVAQRRLPALLQAGADVLLVAPDATPAIEAMATAGELRWQRREYAAADLDGAWYVLAATDRPEVNAAVAVQAEAARVFCVRADRGSAGSAVTPATGEQGGFRVGVVSVAHPDPGPGGGAPGAGSGHPGYDPRRLAAVRDGIVEALREGRLSAMPAGEARPGTVALVGGGPGDPDLITVRGRRLLAHADVVVADRLGPRALLDELPGHVEIVDAAKLPRGRAMTQQAINQALVEHALAGRFVVRLKGGDPFVFGRGWEEVEACAAAGVPVTVVPGISSALAVPALAGIPLTHRGVAHEAAVVTGHVPPDDPRSLVDWSALAQLRGTLVVLMGVQNLAAIVAALVEHGRPVDTPVAVVQDGSMPAERVVRGTLVDIAVTVAEQGLRPPAVIVVGGVAAIRLPTDGG
jgi:uroporphyrin-III C-methyltransferase / precorrin-2 dehydrogenase / sirohydrochlorin ferrochelatase